MNILKAWEIIENHTFFAAYWITKEGKKTFFNDWKNAVSIYPMKDDEDGGVVWWCEYGCLSEVTKENDIMFYHDYELDIKGKTYEECIVKLATWLIKNYGEDFIDNYYNVTDDSTPFLIPIENSKHWTINPEYKTWWDEDLLLEKMKLYGFDGI